MTGAECPCGSGNNYQDCCEPFIRETQYPQTAEQLMRSRYSAYAKEEFNYLADSEHPKVAEEFGDAEEHRPGEKLNWKSLKILNKDKGGPDDQEGMVEFEAYFEAGGRTYGFREKSRFLREEGRWYYLDGETHRFPYRTDKKPGRNDPCSCGSGKKFKKCCGK